MNQNLSLAVIEHDIHGDVLVVWTYPGSKFIISNFEKLTIKFKNVVTRSLILHIYRYVLSNAKSVHEACGGRGSIGSIHIPQGQK
jgi:hypothetical protein